MFVCFFFLVFLRGGVTAILFFLAGFRLTFIAQFFLLQANILFFCFLGFLLLVFFSFLFFDWETCEFECRINHSKLQFLSYVLPNTEGWTAIGIGCTPALELCGIIVEFIRAEMSKFSAARATFGFNLFETGHVDRRIKKMHYD